MIELSYGNDKSVRVSSGKNSFGIAFCEVPRASDKADRRRHRVHTPLTDSDGYGPKGSSLHVFPFTMYKNSTGKKNTEDGSHYIAIKDDKAFAIRMFSSSPDMESAFKVKVWIGGVNVLQHTTTDGKQQSQDYFVVSEQKWVWGKQVDETTARQFRVFGHSRKSLSARSQLVGDNIVKQVEIEISSREQRPRTPDNLARYRSRSRSPTDESPSHRSRSESPAATLVQTDSTDVSILSGSDSIAPSPSTRPTTRQGSTPTLDEATVVSFSSSGVSSQGCSCNHDNIDLESIHSTPEEGAATKPHQMVIGTGGLIRQIVEKDQHPEWADSGEPVTLRFKIYDPEFFEEETNIPLGNPGGNYEEKVPNPPQRCFKPHPPLVQNPERLRKELLSPMELEEGNMSGDVEDDLNAFLGLWSEARGQPRQDQPPQPIAGLMMKKPTGPEPEKEPERTREPKPVLQRPSSALPGPGRKPEKREQRRSNTGLARGLPRNTSTGTCTTTGLTRKESTKRWKSKWRKFITAMRRLLSPG